MKTKTKKRLLGGYFKNSAYHEMYGGVQSKIQTDGPNRDDDIHDIHDIQPPSLDIPHTDIQQPAQEQELPSTSVLKSAQEQEERYPDLSLSCENYNEKSYECSIARDKNNKLRCDYDINTNKCNKRNIPIQREDNISIGSDEEQESYHDEYVDCEKITELDKCEWPCMKYNEKCIQYNEELGKKQQEEQLKKLKEQRLKKNYLKLLLNNDFENLIIFISNLDFNSLKSLMINLGFKQECNSREECLNILKESIKKVKTESEPALPESEPSARPSTPESEPGQPESEPSARPSTPESEPSAAPESEPVAPEPSARPSTPESPSPESASSSDDTLKPGVFQGLFDRFKSPKVSFDPNAKSENNAYDQLINLLKTIDLKKIENLKKTIENKLSKKNISNNDIRDIKNIINDFRIQIRIEKNKLDNIVSVYESKKKLQFTNISKEKLNEIENEINKLKYKLEAYYKSINDYNDELQYLNSVYRNKYNRDNRYNRDDRYGRNDRYGRDRYGRDRYDRDNRYSRDNRYGRDRYGRDDRYDNRGDDKLRQELQRYNNRGDEINKLNRKIDDEGKRLQGLERPNIEGKREGIRPQGMPLQPGQKPEMPIQQGQIPQRPDMPVRPQGMPIQPGQKPDIPGQRPEMLIRPGQRPGQKLQDMPIRPQGIPGQKPQGMPIRPGQKDKKQYVFKKRRPEDLLISDSDSDSDSETSDETSDESDTDTDTYIESDSETTSSDDESVVDVPDVPINKYMLNDLMHILKDIGRNDRNRFLNILNNDYLYNPRLQRYMMNAPENVYNRYNLFIEHLHENTNNDSERREIIGLIKNRNDKLNRRTFRR